MIYKMTNFYHEQLPVDSSFEKLLKIYVKTVAMVWRKYEYMESNLLLEEAKTLDTIPYFKLDVREGMYDKRTAQYYKTVLFETMLSEMDKNNYFVTLNFNEQGSRTPIVYSMDLKTGFASEKSMELYTDYFIRENRLYILPDFILSKEQVLVSLHAFNIKIDRKTLEKNWGSLFAVEAGPLLPRYQYRDVLSSFQRTLMSDLRIKDIRDGIRLATGWKEFKVEDRLTPSLSIAKKRLYDEWMISPSKFLVSLPEYLIKDKLRLNVLLSLLDEVKQSQTNYMVAFEILRKDTIEIPDPSKKMISMKLRDVYTHTDRQRHKISMDYTDYFYDVYSMYDSFLYYDYDTSKYDNKRKMDFYFPKSLMTVEDRPALDDESRTPFVSMARGENLALGNETVPYYDYNFSYDDDVSYDLVEVNRFDAQSYFDQPKLNQTDRFYVKHVEFPEIPRNFSYVYDMTIGYNRLSIRSNQDGTMTFELFGSESKDGTYELIETRENDPSLEKITFLHNANESGKRYYKVRAVAGSSVSFLTLPVDIMPTQPAAI